MYIILTVEGFPDFGRTTSDDDDDDDSGISSTGVSTIVLAILLSVAIVISVIAVGLYLMKRGSVHHIIIYTLVYCIVKNFNRRNLHFLIRHLNLNFCHTILT